MHRHADVDVLVVSLKNGPNLKKFMDKQLSGEAGGGGSAATVANAACPPLCAVQMNGSRKVIGTMRGYDQFMNIVLENATEDRGAQGKFPIPDMLVRTFASAAFFFPVFSLTASSARRSFAATAL